jgi:hypothetical protein
MKIIQMKPSWIQLDFNWIQIGLNSMNFYWIEFDSIQPNSVQLKF